MGDRQLVVGMSMGVAARCGRMDSDMDSSPDYASASVQLSMKLVHCNWTLTNSDERGR